MTPLITYPPLIPGPRARHLLMLSVVTMSHLETGLRIIFVSATHCFISSIGISHQRNSPRRNWRNSILYSSSLNALYKRISVLVTSIRGTKRFLLPPLSSLMSPDINMTALASLLSLDMAHPARAGKRKVFAGLTLLLDFYSVFRFLSPG